MCAISGILEQSTNIVKTQCDDACANVNVSDAVNDIMSDDEITRILPKTKIMCRKN